MRLFIIIFLNSLIFNGIACDVCGGSSFGLDANMLSSNNGNSIGLHFSSKNYKLLGEDEGEQSWLLSWTLNGNYKPHDKVQIKAFLPFLMQSNSLDENQAGLGDLLLLTSYSPLEKKGEKHAVLHKITLSGGLELPTGRDNSDNERMSTIPFSSKSVDIVLGGSYALSIKRYVMATSILGKVNTKNKTDYKYGNSIETIWQNSIKIDAKDAQLFPFIGVKYNWQKEDVSNGFIRPFSGGTSLWKIMGMQFNYYQHKLAVQFELPLYQNLNSESISSGNTYNIQYTYQF